MKRRSFFGSVVGALAALLAIPRSAGASTPNRRDLTPQEMRRVLAKAAEYPRRNLFFLYSDYTSAVYVEDPMNVVEVAERTGTRYRLAGVVHGKTGALFVLRYES